MVRSLVRALLNSQGGEVSGTCPETPDRRSVENTFPRGSIHTEISPLRFASVEMTKGRVALPERVVAEEKRFFIALGGLKAHDSSVEKHFQERAAEPQVPPLRFAPVGGCDFFGALF